jgi:RNase P/RNase MRP subunit p30
MNKYCDLFIKTNNDEEFRKIINIIKKFGYEYIGFEKDENKKKICDELNIKYIIRSKEYKIKEKNILRFVYFTNKHEVINIIKRYKVNLLTINSNNILNIDEKLINFIAQRNVYLEILYSDYLDINIINEKKLIKKLSEIIKYCIRKEKPIIVSSGAENSKQIKAPRDILGFFSCLNLEKYIDKNLITLPEIFLNL